MNRDMKETSDEELMAMFQTGNIMAFDLLFDKYRVPVFNFIFRMLAGDRTAAEDLLQNIFIKIAGARNVPPLAESKEGQST